MKLEIKLNDKYNWEDELIPNQLAKLITQEVCQSIRGSIQQVAITKIEEECKRLINSTIEKRIEKKCNEFIKKMEVKSIYNSLNMVSIDEYLKEKIGKTFQERRLEATIEEIAKKQVDEFKKRYDLLFASQLVAKMTDAGLVNKDIAKLLLDK